MSELDQQTADLSPDDVREVGNALYFSPWQTQLGEALGTSRQTVAHYLRHGVSGSQAAALVGLVARRILEKDEEDAAELAELRAQQLASRREKVELLTRLENKVHQR